MKPQYYQFVMEETDAGLRLDRLLARRFPQFSRQYLQNLLKEGRVLVDGKAIKPSKILMVGQKVEMLVPLPRELELKANPIPLQIVFENEDCLVIDKQAGLVVHPGSGSSHQDDTLVNAILAHCPGGLSGIGGVMRPGIVHRLDKDTSGLLIVAKNDTAHRELAAQMEAHEIQKVYLTLLVGHLEHAKGSIDAPIGRSSANRKKMAVVASGRAKAALTHYEVLQTFIMNFPVEKQYSLVRVRLVTGRTHQIRVHFSSIGYPVVGDLLYGREKINHFFAREFGLKRQFLHAAQLSFCLPRSKKKVTFTSDLPSDLQLVLDGFKL